VGDGDGGSVAEVGRKVLTCDGQMGWEELAERSLENETQVYLMAHGEFHDQG
jgi:hypothetical protein